MGWLGLFAGASIIYLVSKLLIDKGARPRIGDSATNSLFDAGERGLFGNAACSGLVRWWLIFFLIIIVGFIVFMVIGLQIGNSNLRTYERHYQRQQSQPQGNRQYQMDNGSN